MGVSTAAYSPKEFQFLIAEQDAFGTIEAGGGNAYHALDVDSVGSPSLNPTQSLDVRNGGRVLQANDFFQDVKASVKEISVSGTATTNALDMLLENIMGEAEGSASGVYTFASNASSQSVGSGDSSQAGTLLSIVIKSGFGTNADLSFKDCVVTNLSLNGDVGTEGGRIKFSATFQTGSVVEDLTDAATTVDTAFAASENYFMSSWVAAYRKIYGVDDLVMQSFNLTLDNPATFSGVASTGYEVVTRASEFSATLDATVKYDAETEDFFEKFNNQTNHASTAAQITLLNDDSSLTDGTFGISMPLTVLTNVAFNEGDVMMVDLSVKAVGTGSDALVEVAC
tara:strand:+ start:1170 stop:2189 length:1020 start_codon:yes stop_codon:yes gene_type:complete